MSPAPPNRPAPARGAAPPHGRLPDRTRVGGVRLQVAHLDRSLHYYTDVVGLRVIETSSAGVRLGPPASSDALVTLDGVAGTRPISRRGAFGLFHFAILLPDRPSLGRFVAHLAARGLRAGMADHRVSEAIYLWDPDGLGIEIYTDRPRDTWQLANDELVMTTDPLDVGDLAAAGEGRAWTGAPAGTTMGHVHLHVGDLDAAEAFYHRALGFDVTVRSYPGARFFSAGGYHHHLGTNTWSRGPAPAVNQARLLEWTLIVPSAADADAAVQRLADAGHPVVRADSGGVVADPWGTPLRVATEA